MEGLRKTKKNSVRITGLRAEISNPGPPKYEEEC
jgi:hypothetical protein